MKYTSLLLGFSLFFLFACGNTEPQEEPQDTITPNTEATPEHNTLTEAEKGEGWQLLFDGTSAKGWHNYGQDTLSGWEVKDGELIALGLGGDLGGDIVSDEEFEDFEFALEWKISPEGNSGIFFSVVEEGYDQIYHTGPEYQLLDDVGFPPPLEDWQLTGANYAMHTAPEKTLKPVGEYNSSRIVKKGPQVEHWLNGEKIVAYELWTEEWEEMVRNSKWKDYPGYGKANSGKLGLQDHGNKIWFRNIKVRRL